MIGAIKKTKAWRVFRGAVEFVLWGGLPDRIYSIPMQKERIDWLRKKRSGRTLEVGSGTGFVLNHAKGQVGLEISEHKRRIAVKKFPHLKFVQGDAVKMPFGDEEFDTVMVPEILEHVPFPVAQKIAKECLRVAKKQVLVTLPNAAKPDYDKELVENLEHQWMPTPAKVRTLLPKKTRYAIEHDSGKNFLLVRITK